MVTLVLVFVVGYVLITLKHPLKINKTTIALITGVGCWTIYAVLVQVATAMGMYDLKAYPRDSTLWAFMAYCAGTGGSLLLIGSAWGVAVMGMERLAFGWYLGQISWLVLIGYGAGVLIYLAQIALFS